MFIGTAFKSFERLPEPWTLGAKKYAFNVMGALPPVAVTLVAWYCCRKADIPRGRSGFTVRRPCRAGAD